MFGLFHWKHFTFQIIWNHPCSYKNSFIRRWLHKSYQLEVARIALSRILFIIHLFENAFVIRIMLATNLSNGFFFCSQEKKNTFHAHRIDIKDKWFDSMMNTSLFNKKESHGAHVWWIKVFTYCLSVAMKLNSDQFRNAQRMKQNRKHNRAIFLYFNVSAMGA